VRAALIGVLAAVLALVVAPVGTSKPLGATPAAAPFADAWASVPASPEARKAQNTVVFGGTGAAAFAGFNVALACCNSGGSFEATIVALRGAFNQNAKGVWFKDLVSSASATTSGVSYTIKSNANWYWGGKKVPVTYKDFVYTLQQIDDPKNDLAFRTGYGNLDPIHFTHKGSKQVTFFWKTKNCSPDFPCGPYANWQSLFSVGPGLYPSFALNGLDFNKIWRTCICGFDGKPVSDGPFYLSNYTPGQGTTLKANPFWPGKKPGVAEIDFKFFLDDFALEEAIRGGGVDAGAPDFGAYLLPLKSTPGITYDQIPGYYLDHLEFREGNAKGGPGVTKGSSNALLRAPWFREAIALGIDRQRIIKAVFGALVGNAKPMNNLVFFSNQEPYKPDFARWSFNPAKALALLKKHCAAGTGPAAPDPANAKIWQCSGLPATLSWTWLVGNDGWTTTAQVVKAELRSIGIETVAAPLPLNVIFGANGLASGGFDISEFWTLTSGDPSDWYDTYRCSGLANWTGYCNHTVDTLMTAANSELDPAKRASLLQRADAIMATEVPMLPMYQRPIALVHRSDLLGMVQNPDVGGAFWNVEDWHWKS
jgi:ABC-type transport system substrate-binding protein